jgi:F0F1-type ATP synthase, beta subunit
LSKGKIVQVSGPVIDVEFKGVRVPKLREALTVKVGNETRTMEVAQLLGAGQARCIILSQSEGLARGMEVTATGAGISVPVGDEIGRASCRERV